MINIPVEAWLLLAYTIGTGVGMYWRFNNLIEKTIDSLIDNGYLKYRTKANGELDILKKHETE